MSSAGPFPDRFVTDRLTLCPLAITDVARVFETHAADIEVTRFLTWTPHRSISQTRAHLTGCVDIPIDRSRTYASMTRNDGTLQGAFDLRRVAPHRLEFGMVLTRRAWGHGLMSEALTAVVAWALAQPEVRRIGAVCDVEICPKACCGAGRCVRTWATRHATAWPSPAPAHHEASCDRAYDDDPAWFPSPCRHVSNRSDRIVVACPRWRGVGVQHRHHAWTCRQAARMPVGPDHLLPDGSPPPAC